MSALRLKNILIIPFFLFGIALLVVGCSQSQSGRKILYYANPMVPTDHSDKPKKDPMGMDYVPVYEDEVNQDTEATAENEQTDQKNGEVAGYVPVKITPEKQQLIGVKYGVVERKELTKHIQTVGKVAHETEIYNLQQEYFSALKYYQDAKKVDRMKQLMLQRSF